MVENRGVLGNLIWKFAERMSAQIVSAIVSIVLARLLAPSDYGVVSIVTVFITFANVFVSDGLGSALIQKKDVTSRDFFSVLYFNIGISIILYFVLFLSAPWIAKFYGTGYELLTPLLRILGLRLILASINSIQQAYVAKKMIFRKLFISSLFGTLVSGIVGIIMAYAGFGVWSLVTQYMLGTILNTVLLTLSLKIVPKFEFSFNSIWSLFPFGVRILGTALLISGFEDIKALIIGKRYSSADLAFYDKGKLFPTLIITNVNSSISSVMFAKMSNEQSSLKEIKTLAKKSIQLSSYVMMPMMLGMAAVSPALINFLLTETWIETVPLLQLFCLAYLFQPIHSINMQINKALGRGDIYFKLEIVKKIIEGIVLLITVFISVEAIVIGMVLCTTLFTYINTIPSKKLIGYGFREQIKDIFPALVMSIIMAIVVLLVGNLPISNFYVLVLQLFVGILSYALMSVITKNIEFGYLISTIKKVLKINRVP